MTLHSDVNCEVDGLGATGTFNHKSCSLNVGGPPNFAGCSFEDTQTASFGTAFNQNNGGVFAVEWTSTAIKIWFLPRDSTPSKLANALSLAPQPSLWGDPSASFQGPCNIQSHFRDQRVV
jgi:hypothetical protein